MQKNFWSRRINVNTKSTFDSVCNFTILQYEKSRTGVNIDFIKL